MCLLSLFEMINGSGCLSSCLSFRLLLRTFVTMGLMRLFILIAHYPSFLLFLLFLRYLQTCLHATLSLSLSLYIYIYFSLSLSIFLSFSLPPSSLSFLFIYLSLCHYLSFSLSHTLSLSLCSASKRCSHTNSRCAHDSANESASRGRFRG